MEIIFVILALSVVIAFIVWQFKVIMKYSFKYDKLSIDEKRKCIILNNEKILFNDIEYIDVKELEQPSIYEKALSKGAFGIYMSEMILFLKNKKVKICTFNYKAHLCKTLEKLKPYVKINVDIKELQSKVINDNIIILLLVLGCILIFKFW